MNNSQSKSRMRRFPSRAYNTGINLIELLIAMALGLLVVAGAVGIFVSNQRTYAATETLGRIQENARAAFELMARELREAGGDPCSNRDWAPANVLNGADVIAPLWWRDWGTGRGIRGYDESQTPAGGDSRVPGTDLIDIMTAAGSGMIVNQVDSPPGSGIILTNANHPFQTGDILMICDFGQAVIFQMTGPAGNPGTNNTIQHASGPGSPGNCTQGLAVVPQTSAPVSGVPLAACTNAAVRRFGQGPLGGTDGSAMVSRVAASRWYIGNTGRTNSITGQPLLALFRSTPRVVAGVWRVDNEEIAEGVTNMQLTYLRENGANYIPAAGIAGPLWKDVHAVNITLTLSGLAEGERLDGGILQRQVNYVVNLRNRTQ